MKNKMANKKITKKMKFSEIMKKHPEVAEFLFEKGMHCFGCAMAQFETLEQGALAHGMNPDELVEEINKELEKGKDGSKKK